MAITSVVKIQKNTAPMYAPFIGVHREYNHVMLFKNAEHGYEGVLIGAGNPNISPFTDHDIGNAVNIIKLSDFKLYQNAKITIELQEYS